MNYRVNKYKGFNTSDSNIILFYLALMMLFQEVLFTVLMLLPQTKDFVYDNYLAVSTAVQLLFYIPILVYAFKSGVYVKHALRFKMFKFKDLLLVIFMAVVSYVAIIWILGITATIIQVTGGSIETTSMLEEQILNSPTWLLIISIVLMPGFFEEMSFRGIVLGGYAKQQGVKNAIILSAFLFALMHAMPIKIFSTMYLGLVIGFIYVYTGSLWLVMIYHMLHNAFSLWGGIEKYLVYLPDTLGFNAQTSVLGTTATTLYSFGVIVTCTVLSIAGLYLLSRRKPLEIKLSKPEKDTSGIFIAAVIMLCLRYLLGTLSTYMV